MGPIDARMPPTFGFDLHPSPAPPDGTDRCGDAPDRSRHPAAPDRTTAWPDGPNQCPDLITAAPPATAKSLRPPTGTDRSPDRHRLGTSPRTRPRWDAPAAYSPRAGREGAGPPPRGIRRGAACELSQRGGARPTRSTTNSIPPPDRCDVTITWTWASSRSRTQSTKSTSIRMKRSSHRKVWQSEKTRSLSDVVSGSASSWARRGGAARREIRKKAASFTDRSAPSGMIRQQRVSGGGPGILAPGTVGPVRRS